MSQVMRSGIDLLEFYGFSNPYDFSDSLKNIGKFFDCSRKR